MKEELKQIIDANLSECCIISLEKSIGDYAGFFADFIQMKATQAMDEVYSKYMMQAVEYDQANAYQIITNKEFAILKIKEALQASNV